MAIQAGKALAGHKGKAQMNAPYYVYILASKRNGTLYTGVTGDLRQRIHEHKHKLIPGFTAKYNVSLLVYFEETNDVYAAINREKQIKSWKRAKKIALLEKMNPLWTDLAAEWDKASF